MTRSSTDPAARETPFAYQRAPEITLSSEREFTQRLGRILRPKDDGGRAILYEVVSEETAEERVARRRR